MKTVIKKSELTEANMKEMAIIWSKKAKTEKFYNLFNA